MNRNIITEEDVRAFAPSMRRAGDLSAMAPVSPATVPKVDTYFDRLSKYIPMEIIGAYLLVEGILKELLKGDLHSLSWGLLTLFVIGEVLTCFFVKRVLGVIRKTQVAISALAFFVWVFATGGWFATMSFWAPGWGSIAVIAFVVVTKIVKIGPLPPEPVDPPSL